MSSLEWRDVDFASSVIRLRSKDSKNKDSREIPFSLFPELGDILARQRENRRLDCRTVFHHNVRPLLGFRTSGANACAAAGLTKVLVHNLRRTAVRNLVRAGVPEAIVRSITGHTSHTVFERCIIVSSHDKQTALQKLASYLSAQPTTPTIVPLTASERIG
jgi:integrase